MDQKLPQSLTFDDQKRIGQHLVELQERSGGNGLIGLWSRDTKQLFVATVAEGELAGWVLMPAHDELSAERLGRVAGELLTERARIIAEQLEAASSAAIARAAKAD